MVNADAIVRRFGQAVRQIRRRQGMSQQQLALRAGLSLPYISTIERGKRVASLETAVRLARGFRMRPSALLAEARL